MKAASIMEPTNLDLYKRMIALEEKVDGILSKLNQVSGVWIFLKWIGGIVMGVAILYNSFHDWWFK